MSNLHDYLNSLSNPAMPKEDMEKIFHTIASATKEIAGKVNRAGLIDILGSAGAENVQGEEQQKLDVLADEILIQAFRESGIVAAIASEEHENIVSFGEDHRGPYVATFDPLDGSSNIDVDVSIGTIFSVYRRADLNTPPSEKDFLRSGMDQLIAGYVIYGPSTVMVMTVGAGTQGFTLNPDAGEYQLSHPNIETPSKGKIYSLNEGNYNSFSKGVQNYLEYCKSADNDQSSPYSARYIGSMVGDLHRNLIKGGIFMYPATAKAPNGKLRLLYECLPMAFVVEEAGGMAHNGKDRVMNLNVEKLHQRIPIAIGSENMVEKLLEFTRQKETA